MILRDILTIFINVLVTLLLLPLIIGITSLCFALMFIPCIVAFSIFSFKTLTEYIKL